MPPTAKPAAIRKIHGDRLAAGDMASDAGDLAKAVFFYLQAVKSEPSRVQGWVSLAEAYRRKGLYRQAESSIRRALRLDPGIAHAYSILGNILAEKGRLQEAAEAFGTSLRISPDSLNALRDLTAVLLRLGRGGQALLALGAALERDSSEGAADQAAKIYWETAADHGEPGTEKERRTFFLKLLEVQRKGNWLGLFRTCCMLGRYDEAFEAVGKMMRSDRFAINQLCDPFASLMPRPFLQKQAASLAGTATSPGFGTLRSFYLRMWDPAAYGAGAEKEAVLSGRYGWINYVRACEAKTRGDCAGALRLLRPILRTRRKDWLLNCTIAEILLCLGKRREAFSLLEAGPGRAFMKDPGATAWKGECLLFAGQYAKAIKELTAALAGRNGLATTWRGAAYYRTGRPAEALNDLDAALTERPNDLEARAWRGEVYRSLKRYGPALKDLDFILSREPDYVWAYVNRALIKSALGDAAGLRRDFDRIADSPLLRLVKSRASIQAGAKIPAGRICSLLAKALELSKGNRRTDPTLLKISFPEYKTVPHARH